MPSPCEQPCYHSICVGVAYHPSLRPLPFADSDAARVHRYLTARGVHSTLLTGLRATKARFLAALETVAARKHPGDHLLFYFSGHGGSDAHAAPEGPQDRPEFLQFGVGRLFDHELAAALTNLQDVNVLTWLDACQSGGMAGTAAGGVLGRAEDATEWAQLIGSDEAEGFATGQIGVGSYLTNAMLEVLSRDKLPKSYVELVQDVGRILEKAGKKRPAFKASKQRAGDEALAFGREPRVLDGENLQAHTLLGFPKFDHQALLFFRAEEPARLRTLLQRLQVAPTSAHQLLSNDGTLTSGTSLSFTFEGLKALGAPRLQDFAEYSRRLAPRVEGAPQNGSPGYYRPNDPYAKMGAFERGMAGRSSVPLRDPWNGTGSSHSWKVGGRFDAREHGLLIVAANTPGILTQRVEQLKAAVQGLTFIEELGYRHKEHLEHFGFRDGVSRPGIAARFERSTAPQPGIIPANATQVHAPEELLLVPPATPPAPGVFLPSWAEFGSFLAYRRLNQDVRRFTDAIAALAVELNVSKEQAASMLIGRTHGGVSLADHAGTVDQELLRDRDDLDSFDYSEGACPVFAHARKVNPRAPDRPTPPLFRRGFLFGAYLENPEHDDASERGLHFLSYQASIEAQFETVMHWIHGRQFPQDAAGIDALVGRHSPENWPQQRRVTIGNRPVSLTEFVHATGGAYLFAPSLAGVRTLLDGA